MDEQHGLIFGARVGYTGKFSIYMYQTITFYQLHQELLMLTCAIGTNGFALVFGLATIGADGFEVQQP